MVWRAVTLAGGAALALALSMGCAGEDGSADDLAPDQGGQTGALTPPTLPVACGPIVGADRRLTLSGERQGFVVNAASNDLAMLEDWVIRDDEGQEIAIDVVKDEGIAVARPSEPLLPGTYELAYSCNGSERLTTLTVPDPPAPPTEFFAAVTAPELGRTRCADLDYQIELEVALNNEATPFTDTAQVTIRGEMFGSFVIAPWGSLLPTIDAQPLTVSICRFEGMSSCLPRGAIEAELVVELVDASEQPTGLPLTLDTACDPARVDDAAGDAGVAEQRAPENSCSISPRRTPLRAVSWLALCVASPAFALRLRRSRRKRRT